MATKHNREQVATIIAEVESIAKNLRASIRKQAKALPKEVQSLATRLRKQAAHAAAQVEKYAHEMRLDLEGNTRPTRSVGSKRRKA